MSKRDRLYYDRKYKSFIEKLKTGNERNPIGLNDISRMELFKITTALGLDYPENFSGAKEGLFLLKDLKLTKDEALFYTVLLGKSKTNDDIDLYSDLELNFVESEKCSNKGLSILSQWVEKYNSDELLRKEILRELDVIYNKNIKLR